MHIETIRIKNFRRLKDVRIDLGKDISVFVGANNSGKTSAAHAVELFLSEENDGFAVHDFSADTWAAMNAFGNEEENSVLPAITLDLWLGVEASDLHRVMDLLPSLAWQGSLVGVRIQFGPADPDALLERFKERRAAALAAVMQDGEEPAYNPSPKNLHEHLTTNVKREYQFRYFVLDRAQFDNNFVEAPGYAPQEFDREKGRSGKDVVSSLIRVDTLYAQRHLSDSAGGARAEDLTKRIGRIYQRSMEKRASDPGTVIALMQAEELLNTHLADAFKPFLGQIGELGYPGVANPRLVIKSTLNPVVVLSSADGAEVHYALSGPDDEETLTLPDRYNGLGYKNLIYMVIELLDLHSRWIEIEANRPPLHLVFIEEPEAHLHMQLQQVFIRKVLDILKVEGPDAETSRSQVVVTTHSSHILYERGFVPVRYFRRQQSGTSQRSEVLNLSTYYDTFGQPKSEFLVRYLKLTHCDLFFADAVILVEGNVERILLPQMVERAAPRLLSTYLSILEVSGAYAYLFRSLIEFLGITALVVTDIDSVNGAPAQAAAADGAAQAAAVAEPEEQDPDDEDDGPTTKPGKACLVSTPDAVTSNQTLIQWLPAMSSIADLLAATPDNRTQARINDSDCLVRVTYQRAIDVTWGQTTKAVVGRTLEEAFALENLAWCQEQARKPLRLWFRGAAVLSLDDMVERIHKRVKSSAFKKTGFALELLAQDPLSWRVPTYISEGLEWLQSAITPPEPVVPAPIEQAPVEAAPQVAQAAGIAQ